jgi:hypothetical protein
MAARRVFGEGGLAAAGERRDSAVAAPDLDFSPTIRQFAVKAARILALYARRWEGHPLGGFVDLLDQAPHR